MSGENIVVYGTQSTLEASGAAVSNNAVALASTASYDTTTTGYPDAEFVLTATFAVAPVEGSAIALYARPLDVDGTLDTEVPEALRPTMYIGVFIVNNVTTSQTMLLYGTYAYNLPRNAEYYIHNNATGQQVTSGWTLKVTPRTNKAAP